MNKDKNQKKEAKRVVWIFGASSFLNDLGSDIIYPIWPLFVRSVLGAPMSALGFIDGLGDALVAISQAVSGYWSDRVRKRKVFVWIGYLMGSLSRVGYAISAVWPHLIPFRALDRAGKMRGAPRDAIIADVSTEANRGQHFGILRTMDHMGAICGVLLCLILVTFLSYRVLFLIAAVPSLIGVGLILAMLKERPVENVNIYRGVRLTELTPDFRKFLICSALFSLGWFSYSFLVIYAREAGFSVVMIPVLYLIFTAGALLSSYPLGRLADSHGRKPIIQISFFLWAVVCMGFILYPTKLIIVLLFILYGIHRGGLETLQKTFVSELAPKDFRASAIGGYQMVIGLCALPASLIAGVLWDVFSKAVPFYFSLVLTIAAMMILLKVEEEERLHRGLPE